MVTLLFLASFVCQGPGLLSIHGKCMRQVGWLSTGLPRLGPRQTPECNKWEHFQKGLPTTLVIEHTPGCRFDMLSIIRSGFVMDIRESDGLEAPNLEGK